MSTDCVGTERFPIRLNEFDRPVDTLDREWWHAGIAFAVLLALLAIGSWATSATGDQRGSTPVPVIHESF